MSDTITLNTDVKQINYQTSSTQGVEDNVKGVILDYKDENGNITKSKVWGHPYKFSYDFSYYPTVTNGGTTNLLPTTEFIHLPKSVYYVYATNSPYAHIQVSNVSPLDVVTCHYQDTIRFSANSWNTNVLDSCVESIDFSHSGNGSYSKDSGGYNLNINSQTECVTLTPRIYRDVSVLKFSFSNTSSATSDYIQSAEFIYKDYKSNSVVKRTYNDGSSSETIYLISKVSTERPRVVWTSKYSSGYYFQKLGYSDTSIPLWTQYSSETNCYAFPSTNLSTYKATEGVSTQGGLWIDGSSLPSGLTVGYPSMNDVSLTFIESTGYSDRCKLTFSGEITLTCKSTVYNWQKVSIIICGVVDDNNNHDSTRYEDLSTYRIDTTYGYGTFYQDIGGFKSSIFRVGTSQTLPIGVTFTVETTTNPTHIRWGIIAVIDNMPTKVIRVADSILPH